MQTVYRINAHTDFTYCWYYIVCADKYPRKSAQLERWPWAGEGFRQSMVKNREYRNTTKHKNPRSVHIIHMYQWDTACYRDVTVNSRDWFDMMTSSNGNIFRVTGHLYGEFTGRRWIPHTKASDAELWCFLWSASDKRFSKQSWGWWFKTLSHPLWRQCNGDAMALMRRRHSTIRLTVF